nr:odorant receptor 2 [Holotrichia oblita]
MEDYILKISLKCMYILGAYPDDFGYRLYNILYGIYSFIVTSYFITFIIFEYAELITVFKEDLYEDVAILSVSLLYTTTVWKVIVCNSKNFRKLIEQIREMETKILSNNNKDLKHIYDYYVKWNLKVNKYFIWVTIITVIPFYVSPILEQTSMESTYANQTKNNVTIMYLIKPLPADSWLPFNKYIYYYQAYVYYVIALVIGAGTTLSTDLVFVSMMVFGIGQIKIVQYIFKNTVALAKNLTKNANISYDDALTYTVKHCILMHQIIIRYVKDLDNSMRQLMLIDFAVASMQMATLGLQMIVSGVGWQQMFALEFLCAMLVQLFLFYWHANEIILESAEIASAIWESDWLEYNQEIKNH